MEREKIAEQENVINSKNKNLIVSASAGSGKTTVMVSRIVKLIKDEKIDVRNILVLSYTKASASELKNKIEKCLLETNDDFCISQIENLPVSDVSTIHSFCQKLISKYFYVLGLNPSFSIMEDNECLKLKNLAFKNCLKNFEQEKYFQLLDKFTNGRSERNILDIIINLSNFFDSITDVNWQDKAIVFIKSDYSTNFLCKEINAEAKAFIDKANKLLKISTSNNFNNYSKYLNKVCSLLNEVYNSANIGDKIEAIKNLNFGKMGTESNDFEEFSKQIKLFNESVNAFKSPWKRKNFGGNTEIENSKSVCLNIVKNIFSLYNAFKSEYDKLKAYKSSFDYSDLEKSALNLLNNSAVCEKIKNSYKYVFIDEYQDANEVQEQLINKISLINNKFMVGDVKQCIYEFRQSNPTIFLNTQKTYENDTNSESLFLKSNFRSHKNILEFVDMIFNKVMTISTTGIDYKNTSNFMPKANFNGEEKRVVFDIIINEQQEKETASGVYSVKNHKFVEDEESKAEKEAYVVANHIFDFMKNKYIYDNRLKENNFRKPKYSDFAVLLRSRENYLPVFAKTLSELGIPVSVNSKSNLKDTDEGLLLINLLKVFSNKKNDIALVSTMISPFGKFKDEELVKIKLKYKNSYFYQNCEMYAKEINDEISTKLNSFYNLISESKKIIESEGISKALYYCFNKCKIESYFQEYPNSATKIANCICFADYFENSLLSLDEFLSNPICPTVPQTTSESSVVQITTMHSSKGLEFPVVFVCNLDEDLTKNSSTKNIVYNSDIGLAVNNYNEEKHLIYDSIYSECLKKINKNKEFAEKIRLLYVALTRAQNNLFLIGSIKSKDLMDIQPYENESEIKYTKSYLELITRALPLTVLQKIKSGNSVVFGEEKNLSVDVISQIIDISESATNQIKVLPKDINSQILYNYLSQRYSEQKGTDIAFKNSVSSMLEKSEYASENAQPQNLYLKEHMPKISADEGTNYHKILEVINFNNINSLQDIEKELNNLINKNIMCKNDIKSFNINNIYNNIITLKTMSKNCKIFKEQKFMMRVPYNKINENNCDNKILIQGIIDLVICGENNILIDYKYTNIKDENMLKARYEKQIKLYKLAFELATNIKIDNCFILNLKSEKLTEIN